MDVSVVVPIYNVEKYLARCLESLRCQDFEGSYEVLMINDGSTDSSGDIAMEWAQENSSTFIYFEKENGGLSDARNYGIKRASGDYIAFVDSDDYVEPCFISKLYGKAEETNADMVVCSYLIEREDKRTRSIRQKGGHRFFGKSVASEPRLFLINSPYAWNKLYRKSLFLDNNIDYPKGLAYEDIATTYPLMLLSNQVEKVEEPLVHYIASRAGSITGTFNERKLNVLPALKLMVDRSRSALKARAIEDDELENGIFIIAARHIFYRLRELKKYSGIRRRLSFVKEAFGFLEEEFPAWMSDEEKQSLLVREKISIESEQSWLRRVVLCSLVPEPLQLAKRKTKKWIKKIGRLFSVKWHRRYLYAIMRRHLHIRDNVALFESFHGNEVSDSPRAMAVELGKSDAWKVYYSYHDSKPEQIAGTKIRFVKIYSLHYLYLLATSRLLVNSVSFPTYFMRRDGQLYVNTWHGTPLKTLGKGMIHGVEDMNNIQRNFLESTHLIFPDSHTEKQMMRDYSLNNLYSGKLVECVYPRNEPFVACSGSPFGWDKSKAKFAYMPTWRGATSRGLANSFTDDVMAFLNMADSRLGEGQTLFVKLHSLMKDSIDLSEYAKCKPFPEDVAPYDFLSECDALITDYSSVMFDFALSGRPVLLLVPDRYEYEAERGTYLSIDDIPFPKYDDPLQLLEDLSNMRLHTDVQGLKSLLGSYGYVDTRDILKDIVQDNNVEYIRTSKPDERVDVAVICNGCKTPSDISKLKECLVNLIKAEGDGVVVLLRAVDFTDALRDEIRLNSDGLFDNFVITKGKEVRTYSEKLRELALEKTERRKLSALRRLHRYLPGIKFRKVIFFDVDSFGSEAAAPTMLIDGEK